MSLIGSFNFVFIRLSSFLGSQRHRCIAGKTCEPDWFIQLYLSLSDCHLFLVAKLSFLLESVVVCNAALVPKESELPCFPLIQDKTFIAGTGQPPKCSWLAAGDGNTWVYKRSPSQSFAFNLNLYSRLESWS